MTAKRTEAINAMVTPEIKAAVEALAFQRGMTLSRYVALVFDEHVAAVRHLPPAPPPRKYKVIRG